VKSNADQQLMAEALRLARRSCGFTSPNPMVGALLMKGGRVIGRGWHHRAGEPHAEIEALRDARKRGNEVAGATLVVTLEPCSSFGRTPPCTNAIIEARLGRVVIGATDPNPRHCGRGIALLKRAAIRVTSGILERDCSRLNEAFNHWIVHRRPFVTVKAAMTLDGKIATAKGDSKWITGEMAREHGMGLRLGADAIVVGINTILKDDPQLTFRSKNARLTDAKRLQRIVLDSLARTPLDARVVSDKRADQTTIVVSKSAPKKRVAALAKRVRVLIGPCAPEPVRGAASARSKARAPGVIDLRWLLDRLGKEEVTSVLVEGGGEVNASFLMQGLAQRIAFFYAPKVLGGRDARHAVSGDGANSLDEAIKLTEVEWRRFGADLLMTGRVVKVQRTGRPAQKGRSGIMLPRP
jgi:diaminohydroxyphosphoribosylaminopyrimidine deaminase/5-amino-6-(5-phosphoribosylamino)uracil reductase